MSLNPSLEKGVGILKVSNPVSKREESFKGLDSSPEQGIQALETFRPVFLEKLHYTITFGVESLNPSLDHCDPLQFISLDPCLEKGIGALGISIPVSKKGL